MISEQDRQAIQAAAQQQAATAPPLSPQRRDHLAQLLAPMRQRFVCEACRGGHHEQCRGGSWCDCQHRRPRRSGRAA